MKIEIMQEINYRYVSLMEYESTIEPLPGDIYAGINFKDGYQRTVSYRMILPKVPNTILVYVNYSYPDFVKPKNELTEEQTDSAVKDTLLSNHLS